MMNNKPILYVMSGLPGSGKTTFCKEKLKNAVHVSRDTIRFSFLKEGESYFSHEDEVQNKFWEEINNNLAKGKNTIADQTSLSIFSRDYLISKITEPCEKVLIQFRYPIEVCIERNENRAGTKTYVPPKVIENMSKSFSYPTDYDNTIFDKIYIVNNNSIKRIVF